VSAEILREAAALMRARAEAATSDPWPWQSRPNLARRNSITIQTRNQKFLAHYCDEAFADHAASWHPTVALAVADWLEQESRIVCHSDNPTRHHALAVARAYLGRES
jgi:hypothetical protein